MKITIEFPQTMKMIMRTTIDVPESATLQEIKETVFESFWKTFDHHFPSLKKMDGSSMELKFAKTSQKSDEIFIKEHPLKERLKKSTHFQAIFKQSDCQ